MLIDDVDVIDAARFPLSVSQMRQMMGWSFGEEGVCIADLWWAFNERFWGGRLVPCPLFFPRATSWGRWIGLYTRNHDYQTLHIQLKFALSFEDKADVLLHEMVHQYLGESQQNTAHNADPWCQEIIRLTSEIWGQRIHASPANPRKVKGRSVRIQKPAADGTPSISRRDIASWPHSLGLHVPLNDYLVHRLVSRRRRSLQGTAP